MLESSLITPIDYNHVPVNFSGNTIRLFLSKHTFNLTHMKRIIFTFLFSFVFFLVHAGAGSSTPIATLPQSQLEISPEGLKMGMEEFLSLTPKKYREVTGERLGIKNTLKLKAAQKIIRKRLKKNEEDIPKGLYIVLAIFGLGWLGIGLLTDFEGNDWWVNLLLTILCWLPGFIHALIKMKDYY